MKYLFLDDRREPNEVVGYDNIEWTVVRNAQEFEEYLNHGFPDVISFDHDLADEHYDIDWADVYYYGEVADTKNPTGLDCLRSMIQRLIMEKPYGTHHWPMCGVHSTNPAGRHEIEKLLETWSFPRFKTDI